MKFFNSSRFRSFIQGYYARGEACLSFQIRFWLNWDQRYPCHLASSFVRRKSWRTALRDSKEDNDAVVIKAYDRTVNSTWETIRLVPMHNVKEAIRTGLMEPKTVFVSPIGYFDTDWEYFREAMRFDKSLKFARNYNKEDAVR